MNLFNHYVFILCFILTLSQAQAQHTEIHDSLWLTNLEEAKIIATERNLPILIVFAGSDWCRPCIQLNKQVFGQEEFKVWVAQHIVPVMLEFPRQKKNALPPEQQAYNDSMAELYNPKGAFPKVVVTDQAGKEFGSLGFIDVSAGEYILKIEELINKIQ